mmetsp:Transcript_963/g.1720  ORF Transcript_963/g.1720 Transcript_963/m.1720 type:complete len:85 (+) Transcript_963:1619-1873(+)
MELPVEDIFRLILSVLGHKNFSDKEFISVFALLVTKIKEADQKVEVVKERNVRKDLEFWRSILAYLPLIEIKQFSDFVKLKETI